MSALEDVRFKEVPLYSIALVFVPLVRSDLILHKLWTLTVQISARVGLLIELQENFSRE